MAASGLSRRRVNAATSNSASADSDDNSWSHSSTSNSNGTGFGSQSNSSSNLAGLGGSGGSEGTRTAGGSAFERGSKIAYDPRDLDGANEDTGKLGGKLPKLTIMEEVLLLGIKDKQVGSF
jgi:Golgi phosphoprotein 3